MKNLTNQQKKFITEYIKTLDAELSAKNAGYKSTDLKSVADKLLSDSFVIKEIKDQLKGHISSLRVEKGYVVQKLLEIAEFSLEEEEILDKEGGYTGKKKLRDATVGLRALEALCKHLGFNIKNDEPGMPETKIITINNLDEDKI
ncbi:MAG: terminase small subunit [Candidatus Gastranaerophilales bacterium]|nr:terminase small subunit [Candidatus Gastranaerophilales bacterium]